MIFEYDVKRKYQQLRLYQTKKHLHRIFLVVHWLRNPPANAKDMGSGPGLGRFHMPRGNLACALQLLSLRATTAEACVPRARAP